MTLKRLFYKVFLSLALISPLGLMVSCGEFGVSSIFLGIGSNSVSPLVMGQDSFMTHSPIGQYIYQNTGSGDGYKSQMDPHGLQSAFGMTSSKKNPKTYSHGHNQLLHNLKTLWSSKKLRTLTYAFDAISIGVHLPLRMQLTSPTPIIDLKELAKLYSQDKALVRSVSWASLIRNEAHSSLWTSARPIAIGIRGGENTSGKAEAFVKIINKYLSPQAKNPQQRQVAANQKFSFTDSFNDIYLENQNLHGSIAYYSLGQIKSVNLSKIQVAAIHQLMQDTSGPPTIKMVQAQQYKWARPFNMIYSVDNDRVVAFANYLLSPKAQTIILHKNFVPLTLDQIKIQLPTWRPDLDYLDASGKLILKGVNQQKIGAYWLDYGL